MIGAGVLGGALMAFQVSETKPGTPACLRSKFPANRENNREFRRIRPSTAIFVSDQRPDSIACSQIPYAAEQGIFAAITGNFFGITGNLIERGKRPLFARLFCACRTRSVLTCLFAKRGGTDDGRIVLSRALRRAVLAGAP